MTHPREFVGIVMAVAATAMIFFNALYMQHGPHPAPIFARRVPALHRSAPDDGAQHRAQIVADIQRELSRRGFYDDAVDGIWGTKTDAATRGATKDGKSLRHELRYFGRPRPGWPLEDAR